MKPLLVISCPVETMSGYGARSRDIVKALINSGKYEVKILAQRWGSTPFGFLQIDNPEHKKIIDCIQPKNNQIEETPDVWIQITVPNEFQKIGKFNIGMFADIMNYVKSIGSEYNMIVTQPFKQKFFCGYKTHWHRVFETNILKIAVNDVKA